jgi:16S rRNA (guanine527-N7)-methyltransferase
LAIAKVITFPDGYEVMDLGSGGGFPGIPLAIFLPKVKFYLVDSIQKKMKVANEIARAIGLSNVTTRHARAEELQHQQFDVIVSRAVAPLRNLWMWSKPLIKKPKVKRKNFHGLICLKGGDLNKEISESFCRPKVWEISEIFKEDFFKEKYILLIEN